MPRTTDAPAVVAVADEGLAGALRALGAEPVRVDVSAGFFHRTLARWLGLPEGRVPGRRVGTADVDAAVAWDYGLWKAELVRDDVDGVGEDIGGGLRRERWSATLYRVADAAPERVAWTVDKDGRGAIVASAWRTAAPRLIDDAGAIDVLGPAVDAALLTRLADDT
jgi:hypothetical protein